MRIIISNWRRSTLAPLNNLSPFIKTTWKLNFSNYYFINSWGSHKNYTMEDFLFIWKIKESLSNCYTYTPLMVASKRHLKLLSNHDQQFCSRLIGRARKPTKPLLTRVQNMFQGLYQSSKDNNCGLTTHIRVGQKRTRRQFVNKTIFSTSWQVIVENFHYLKTIKASS